MMSSSYPHPLTASKTVSLKKRLYGFHLSTWLYDRGIDLWYWFGWEGWGSRVHLYFYKWRVDI